MVNNVAEYASELLYRIKWGMDFWDACTVYHFERSGKYCFVMDSIDFFKVSYEALNVALMMEVAKLSDCDASSKSVWKFYKYCEADRNNRTYVKNKNDEYYNNLLGGFKKFWDDETVKGVIEKIKTRRDKYYAHNDKGYFHDLQTLIEQNTVYYGEVKLLLEKYQWFCSSMYEFFTGEVWQPQYHQGTPVKERDCKDIVNLLEKACNSIN